jgi:Neuroblastoma-amplified sequence, N terminal
MVYCVCLYSREGDCRQSHVFSFAEHCPNGVYSMVYVHQHNVLIVGSCAKNDSSGSTTGGDALTAASHGITVWRILSDAPHYKLVTDYEMDFTQVLDNFD